MIAFFQAWIMVPLVWLIPLIAGAIAVWLSKVLWPALPATYYWLFGFAVTLIALTFLECIFRGVRWVFSPHPPKDTISEREIAALLIMSALSNDKAKYSF